MDADEVATEVVLARERAVAAAVRAREGFLAFRVVRCGVENTTSPKVLFRLKMPLYELLVPCALVS